MHCNFAISNAVVYVLYHIVLALHCTMHYTVCCFAFNSTYKMWPPSPYLFNYLSNSILIHLLNFFDYRKGFRTIGSDVNAAFIAGTAANLEYAGYSLQGSSGGSGSDETVEASSSTTSISSSSTSSSNSISKERARESMLQLYIKVRSSVSYLLIITTVYHVSIAADNRTAWTCTSIRLCKSAL